MAIFCRSRECFAAVRLATLRSCSRRCFSSSVVALGRTKRLSGRALADDLVAVAVTGRGGEGMGAELIWIG